MDQQPPPPDAIDTLLLWLGGAILWVGGESGRTFVAGGAGGLMRWLFDERRRLRDGVIAVGSGAICAHYLGAVVLAIIEVPMPRLIERGDANMTAGFLAGLVGMSLAKILTAVVEERARRMRGDDDDEA